MAHNSKVGKQSSYLSWSASESHPSHVVPSSNGTFLQLFKESHNSLYSFIRLFFFSFDESLSFSVLGNSPLLPSPHLQLTYSYCLPCPTEAEQARNVCVHYIRASYYNRHQKHIRDFYNFEWQSKEKDIDSGLETLWVEFPERFQLGFTNKTYLLDLEGLLVVEYVWPSKEIEVTKHCRLEFQVRYRQTMQLCNEFYSFGNVL